jgi:proton-dependent oligopeptide transporter, POT family
LSVSERWKEIRTGFSPTFWIANTLELFERFAFYGAKAILTVYIATKVGLTREAGSLAGLFAGLIFSLPVVAGVFVDRYGFRRTLMACFAIFSLGYFAVGLAGLPLGQAMVEAIGKRAYIVGALVLTAVGGSLIKPCIVGTVAKTSGTDMKSLGFSIYYTLVNFGGAVGPILAMQVREGLGIEYVLVMSSITSLLLLAGTFLFFREPEIDGEPRSQASFMKVFRDMLMVFGNLRFMTFLVIFSGFWIMFWQVFYSFPFYVTDVLKFERFEILETVDAWTIIFVSVPITALAKKMKPIAAMTLGFVIASFCWVIVGAWPTVAGAVVGVSLFAVGESLQAPRFYEYVGALAPRDKVGTFMGFAFLPIAIGSFTAGILAGWLRARYLVPPYDTSTMWFIVAGIGFASTLLMLAYNLFAGRCEASAATGGK